MKNYADVVIVGGGPSGISAAIWCKRLGLDHLLLESRDTLGGQLLQIQSRVLDYPGLLSTNGKELQKSLLDHVEGLQCTYLLNTSVRSIDPVKKAVSVSVSVSSSASVSASTISASSVDSDSVSSSLVGSDSVSPSVVTPSSVHGQGQGKQDLQIGYRYLIFSTGSSPRRLHIPGEDEMIKRGELFSASKDRLKFKDKQVAVIGGGDRAFEGALLLAEIGAKVFLIHRSEQFKGRSEYIEPVLSHPLIQIMTHTVVKRIVGEDQSVSGVELLTAGKPGTHFLPVDGVFIRVGMSPNSELLQGIVDMDQDHYIITNKTHQTSLSDIFAIGDVCIRPLYSSISLAIGQGGVAAKTISQRMG